MNSLCNPVIIFFPSFLYCIAYISPALMGEMKKRTESYCPLTAEILAYWLMVQKIERGMLEQYTCIQMFATNTIYYLRFLGKNQISI